MSPEFQPGLNRITSRDNPLLKELRRLSQDSSAYRKQGRFWVEGEHLCQAALDRGWSPALAVLSESLDIPSMKRWAAGALKTIVMADDLFAGLSALESPARMAFVFELPSTTKVEPAVATVILDRLQDAGNVGSILRSASAFGFRQVLALKGGAALWSPKVLRAGMGAHFALHLLEGLELEDLDVLTVPLVVTSSHQGVLLQKQSLPMPCAWIFGHEGQGARRELLELSSLRLRIGQPGGEESLNVAAAAAICLHASSLNAHP
ncbi:MAG: RNA methyltransferase [Burkholderiaceae bacterium]